MAAESLECVGREQRQKQRRVSEEQPQAGRQTVMGKASVNQGELLMKSHGLLREVGSMNIDFRRGQEPVERKEGRPWPGEIRRLLMGC